MSSKSDRRDSSIVSRRTFARLGGDSDRGAQVVSVIPATPVPKPTGRTTRTKSVWSPRAVSSSTNRPRSSRCTTSPGWISQSRWDRPTRGRGRFPGRFPVGYLEQLPGVEFDRDGTFALQEEGDADVEVFYELGLDLHLIDPYTAENYFALDWDDVDELEANVAPFIGSWIRRPQFTDDHPHYDLWEVYDEAAQVFQVQERGEAFRDLHAEMLEEIRAELPPVEERPTVGI
ncbi:hypothetical protein D8S78_04910 [Natrialba swarupiae]|nr:hypothetical protein [Natrialba swarupiae]